MTAEPLFDHFVKAQHRCHEDALHELKNGRKKGHWMWFMFPQIAGLGSSPTARKYSLQNLNEAHAYLAHPVVGPRLVELTKAFLSVQGKSAKSILGYPDNLKMKSSMTLFALCSQTGSVFDQVLRDYFDGERCQFTLKKCRDEQRINR